VDAQFLVNVAVLTSLNGLLALGLVVVYRTSRVLNFAHGALVLITGHVLGALLDRFPWPVAICLSLGAAVAVGVLVYSLFIRWLIGHPPFVAVLMTVAISLLAEAITLFVWRGQSRFIRLPLYSFQLSSARIQTVDFAAIGIFVAALLPHAAFLRLISWGLHMRAAAENPLLAAQRGVRVHRVMMASWAIGAILALCSATIYGARLSLSPSLASVGLQGLSIAMVGGLDSALGVLPAALAVAAAQVYTATYLDPNLADLIPHGLLLGVLIWRPWGLLGTREELERV